MVKGEVLFLSFCPQLSVFSLTQQSDLNRPKVSAIFILTKKPSRSEHEQICYCEVYAELWSFFSFVHTHWFVKFFVTRF